VTGSALVATVSVRDPARERVADVLEAELLAYPGPATAIAIVDRLTVADRATILVGSDEDLLAVVASALAMLVKCGHAVAVPGGHALAHLPFGLSRRQRTLSLCGRAVVALDRAVRASDVWRHAQEYAAAEIVFSGLTQELIIRDLLNLSRTGELVVIAEVRGRRADGRNLVVPKVFVCERADWTPKAPLTWLDYVVEQIRHLLEQRKRDDETSPTQAFSTKELRARLLEDATEDVPVATGRYGVDLEHPMTVTRALRQLAKSNNPLVCSVPQRLAMWTLAQADVCVGGLCPYSSDTDRLIAAAQCATARTGSPVVTADDIKLEIEGDAALTLTGNGSVATMLSDLAKENIASAKGHRVMRREQRLRRVGTLGGHAAYWVSTGEKDEESLLHAEALVALNGVTCAVERARITNRIVALESVISPIVATGRARQLLAEVDQLAERVRIMPRATAGVDACLATLDGQADTIRGWIQFRAPRQAGMPNDIQIEQGGLTALELREIFAPINRTAELLTTGGAVIRQYGGLIRRVRNTRFRNRRSGDAETAPEFLFDVADSLAYAARQWGGPTCQLMTFWAIEEMGELRDPRYLVAALRTENAEIRRRVIGGLALLRAEGARDTILHHVRDDVDAGVRECALWSIGMLLGDAANPLLNDVAVNDPDARVRRAASKFLSIGAHWWWRA
jgi:hypothetical protein